VKLKSLADAWNAFFFAPQSPLPIALFRIIYGALVVADLILLRPDWLAWFGPNSWVSLATMSQVEPGTRLNLFKVIPQTDGSIEALFWISLASAMMLAMGFLTRLNSVIVFVCLASIHQRNLYITHGGDTFLRVTGFFLMFAPAGAALSVDRLIRLRFGRKDTALEACAPWAQRMIQFELALLYFVTFCWKVQGKPWVEGTALYYVFHLDEFRRFPVPSWLLNPLILKLGSWFALALEFSLGVLIWFREIRYYLLGVGLLFHLSLEYALNIPLFQWEVLSGYILFVDAADIERVWNRVRGMGRSARRERVADEQVNARV
jgi:hypothetical protein